MSMNLSTTPNYFQSPPPNTVPISYGNLNFQTTEGNTTGQVVGTGLLQVGQYGLSSSVPYAPGFSPTSVDIDNPLGYFQSPFSVNNEASTNYGPYNFGPNNPFSPIVTNGENPFDTYTSGNFDASTNATSMDSGSAQSLGYSSASPSPSYSYPSSNQSSEYPSSYAGSDAYSGENSGYSSGYPSESSGYASGGYPPSNSYAGSDAYSSENSGYSSGYPSESGYPSTSGYQQQTDPGYVNSYDPGVFTGVGPNQIAGLAQTVDTTSDNYASQFSTLTDGRYDAAEIGSDTGTPEQYWSSSGIDKSMWGIYETEVGPTGGTANAGQYGVQAVGDAFAAIRSPLTGAFSGIASPEYNNFNFATQQGLL